MQNLIISGKLPCTKDECATLAALHLRIYELNYLNSLREEEEQEKNKSNVSSSFKKKRLMMTFEKRVIHLMDFRLGARAKKLVKCLNKRII